MAEKVGNQSSRKASVKRAERPEPSGDFTKHPTPSGFNDQKSPPGGPNPETLRHDYAAAGRQLRRWLWAGPLLLVLGLALWRWGPREQLATPALAPTGGYFFRQAGTVQDADDKTWVWILADTASQAKLLLSADQGRTWRVRDLGLRSNRARALALGWGAPGKGLLVGDSGWVRTVADVFTAPERGSSQQLPDLAGASFRSVALDSQGRRAVAAVDNAVWRTTDAGQSWQKAPLQGSRLVAYWPGRGSFLVVSDREVREISFDSGQNASIAISSEMLWNESKITDSIAAVAFEANNGGFLFTTYSGDAVYWRQRQPSSAAPAAATPAAAYAALPVTLFADSVRPVTLAFWQPGRLDSALLLTRTPNGDQLRRIAVGPQLTQAVASADAYFSSLLEAPSSFAENKGATPLPNPPTAPTKTTVATRQKPAGQKQAAPAVAGGANQKGGGNAKGSEGSAGTNEYSSQRSPSADEGVKENNTGKAAAQQELPNAPKSENNATENAPMLQQPSPTRREPDSLSTQNKQPAVRNYKKKN